MNIEQLQLISRNITSDTLLRLFFNMRQISNETNLESFINYLTKTGNIIDINEYHNFFKELQTCGVGFLVDYHTKTNQFRKFRWKYSIKDVSEQILYPNRMVKIKPAVEEETIEEETVIPTENEMNETKRGRGRPKGSKNKDSDILESHIETTNPTGEVKRRGRPAGTRNKMPTTIRVPSKEVVFMFSNSKGDLIPFNLNDAESLIKQVEKIKENISA